MLKTKLRLLTILAAPAVLVLASCGSDKNAQPPTSVPLGAVASAAPMPRASDFNTADVQFAQNMIPHHRQAVAMADIALDPTVGASAKVVDLAKRIEGTQGPELEMMSGWLTSWGQPMQMNSAMGQSTPMMDGMMTDVEMSSLRKVKGADFDTMWMQLMIRHHTGAIALAQAIKTSGSSADVLAMADQVIAAQQSEITEMQTMLGG